MAAPAPDPLSLAIEQAVERAVARQLATLPDLVRQAVLSANSEPLLPLHELLGCAPAAARMRVARSPALQAVGVRDGRGWRFRASEVRRALENEPRPTTRDTSKARAALADKRAGRRGEAA